MPYIKEKCIAGNTIDYRFYYAPRYDIKGGSRRKAVNKTKEAQKKVNTRNKVKKLTWILNANFTGEDFYITFSYRKDSRPSREQLKKDIRNLLDYLRRSYKKAGKVFRYVWVAEVGERGAVHVHMVLNNIDTQVIKRAWDKGWINIKPLDDNGQYSRLANYFVKYSDTTKGTDGELQKKGYNSSRNLIIPEPEKRQIKSLNEYSHTIEVPAGYYVDKDTIVEAFHEVTGYMYFAYTLVFDGKKKNRYGKEDYVLSMETGEITITENRKENDRMIPPKQPRRKKKHPAKRKYERRDKKKKGKGKGTKGAGAKL